MKAIINGTRYNTERATLIGEADNICRGVDSVSDFAYWEAGLYKTPRSGRYFLAGRGGPMSRFARTVSQSSWSGGEAIIPMSPEEALEWAEQNLATEIIEAAFADQIEDA